MSKLYDKQGDPLCDCTYDEQCEHHAGQHEMVTDRIGNFQNLTCTHYAVTAIGEWPQEEMAEKFTEHLADVELGDE